MKHTRLRRRTRLRARTALRRKTPLAPSRSLAASAAQRDAVKNHVCVVCGCTARVDPAHVIPRSLGGCDHPLCVVALCRGCHRAYDGGQLDLLPHLEPRHRAQVAHAVAHLGLIGALRRITGQRDAPTTA